MHFGGQSKHPPKPQPQHIVPPIGIGEGGGVEYILGAPASVKMNLKNSGVGRVDIKPSAGDDGEIIFIIPTVLNLLHMEAILHTELCKLRFEVVYRGNPNIGLEPYAFHDRSASHDQANGNLHCHHLDPGAVA